jgi:hypothetical protein
VGAIYPVYPFRPPLDLALQPRLRRGAPRSHHHPYDGSSALYFDTIDKTQVYNIEGSLRIVAPAQGRKNIVFRRPGIPARH